MITKAQCTTITLTVASSLACGAYLLLQALAMLTRLAHYA